MNDARLSRTARLVVTIVTLIVGAGAVYGGVGLLLDAERFGAKDAWLDGTPFADYLVPALVLLTVIGGGMFTTALAAFLNSRFAGAAALFMGVVLLIWGVVETMTIGYLGIAQVVLLALFVVAPSLPLLKLGWDGGGARVFGRGR